MSSGTSHYGQGRSHDAVIRHIFRAGVAPVVTFTG